MAGRTGQRGHIENHGAKYRAVVFAGRDPLTGKKRYLKKTSDTEKQAGVELTKLLHQVDQQRQPRSGITVGHLIEKWFEVQEHEESTRKTYVGLVKNYIAPVFGSTQVAKLDAELLETFYARLRKCRLLCEGKRSRAQHVCKPLSTSSVRQIHAILRGSLDRAVRWTYVGVNVAELASPPRAKKSTPDPPSAEEVAAILNEAWRDPEWGLLLWLVMVTGCRRGELCAVRWSDVDLDRKKIALERSVTRSEESPTGLKEKRPKGDKERRLSLDPYTVGLLRAHRLATEAQCKELGTKMARHAFVFSLTPDHAEPIRPDTVTQRYRRLAIRNQLRSSRFHALRHYSATELLTSGVDLKTVSGRLGHQSGATTLRFYVAWQEATDGAAADTISSIIPRPEMTPRWPHEFIAFDLRKAIADGTYPVGSSLPMNEEIRAKYKVATGTVSRAVHQLRDEGLLRVVSGKRPKVIAVPALERDPLASADGLA
ncbi:MAG: integrase [Kribbellaceae bacterium]|jgi:integrase|nr:integrase [Kribbellaceae bacterium]